MFAEKGWRILQERYELVDLLVPTAEGRASESWIALDQFDNEFLVKLWPFLTDAADDLQRALWDAELRTMYRVGSSPGAESLIVVMREAGLEQQHRCFVMVLQVLGASAYETLDEALRHRPNIPWLSSRSVDSRAQIWAGLKRIADGIKLLHDQRVLHRNVAPENIFLNSHLGPSSFRLGGFEWSVRLGELHLSHPPTGWSTPPEFESSGYFGYQPETDWYGFGMLAARCLLNVEAYSRDLPSERNRKVMKSVEQAPDRYLSDLERIIIQRLIARKRSDRLMRSDDIQLSLEELLESITRGDFTDLAERPLLLTYNPNPSRLTERAEELGFVPNPSKPEETYNPIDISHCAALSNFIQRDLWEPQLYALPRENFFVLVGKQLELLVTRFEERDPTTRVKTHTWDLAYCIDVTELRWSEGGKSYRQLPPNSVVVRTVQEIRRGSAERTRSQNWQRYLPQLDEGEKLRSNLAEFHRFVRCTNQIELLMRDSELFQYEITNRRLEDAVENITIREIDRQRPAVMEFRPEGGMLQYFQRELESNKRDCDLVVLTGEAEDSLAINRRRKEDCFRISNINVNDGLITLTRAIVGNAPPTPGRGWLRSFGMFGQIALIRRRKGAIDRLEKHSYLLRSLSATGQVFMDTGVSRLPQYLSPLLVDEAKQAIMKDVLRTRPIYALQGPPGTGKTTMVAHLLRQIFRDDPVAQVLITAQAHGAVDVLRGKVKNEAFADVDESVQPLAIRLGGGEGGTGLSEGSVESVAVRALDGAVNRLRSLEGLSPFQAEWLDYAEQIRRAVQSKSMDQLASEFLELIKRGANITYCTTSAGDLEELAKTTQSYDWTIIEEAGKCHGFDLALPLQAGHRWLLIGDQSQLPPYRWEDYSKGIMDLDLVVEALRGLPERGGRPAGF